MARAITVDEFRRAGGSRGSRNPITRSEWVILAAAAPAVLISPFLLGGMVWWSQLAIAIMQGLILLVAITPYTGWAEWQGRLRKLLRFPPFWLGGMFVIYVIVQALNPSWEQVYLDPSRFFVAERKPEYFIAWLPQSMLTNFYVMNPWRMVIFWAGAWAFTCGLWMGLTSRRAWLALGWMALIAGGVLSLASVAHLMSDNQNLFWLENFKRTEHAFGPFVYRNQGAAYLYLVFGLGLAMFLHLLKRGELRSGLPWMALVLAFACLVGIALNASRGGWLGAGGVLACFLILLPFGINWSSGFSMASLVGAGVVVLGITGVGYWLATTMDFREIEKKWDKLKVGEDVSLGARVKVSEITWEMFEDKPWTGWGAGSFYYRYPNYAKKYPEIYYQGNPGWKHYTKYTINYKQAHNDHFQFLAEYGVAGCSLLVLSLLFWLFLPLSCRAVTVDWLMAIGTSAVFLTHNLGDFFLQNSINLSAWLLLLLVLSGALKSKALQSAQHA